ncbi:hypothetical protein AVEN_57487-1 [Araneus ventricosus]|uniref:PiggyBac transposable element-derived protein domain-containing protein n=1 Tax=Araneus ventricosus TaxID=182803 RepID=A0A4Y2CX46_ARAVE|nr:hypothetical protein AVEN_57487-1 [Araneus ventricosus]
MSEERFSELYADVLSDCPSDFEFSDSDSDDSDIRPSKRQRRILSDSEADSDEEWNDIDIVPSRYKKFLLEVARIWLSSESIESNTQPANTSHASKRAPHKDPVSRLSGKLLDHVLEPIITASKTNPTRKCRVKIIDRAKQGLRFNSAIEHFVCL